MSIHLGNTELDVCPDEPRPCLMSPNVAPILAELANLTHWNSESTVVLFVQPAGLQQGGLVFTNRLINQPFWYVIAITFWLLAMFQLLMYYTSVRNIQLSISLGWVKKGALVDTICSSELAAALGQP